MLYQRNEKEKLNQLPEFKSGDEEFEFWDANEIIDYVDTGKRIRLDFSHLKPSTKTVTLRMSESMVDDIRTLANKNDVPVSY